MLANILQYSQGDQIKIPIMTECGQITIINLQDHEFMRYALNLLLVIEEKRLAYRVGLVPQNGAKLNQYYAILATVIDKQLMVYQPFSVEPYIILKKNYNIVDDLYRQGKEGKLLGYSYTGPHWIGLSLCDLYYTIYFDVTVDGKKYNLYGFNVPSVEYNQEIVDHIEATKSKFAATLEKEGCSIEMGHIYFPKNGNLEMRKGLPEP